MTIDVPEYLLYLRDTFLSRGVRIIQASLRHISEVTTHTPHAEAVIVCAGLGARSLGGVDDMLVFPIRGQTVLIRAPWVKGSATFRDDTGGNWTYIIPRRSGNVVLGGTSEVNDWDTHPSKETTKTILARAARLHPELAGPGRTACTVADLEKLLVEECCGLRPAREGGERLETEVMQFEGRSLPVVHNYG